VVLAELKGLRCLLVVYVLVSPRFYPVDDAVCRRSRKGAMTRGCHGLQSNGIAGRSKVRFRAYSTFELNIHHAIAVLILHNPDCTSSLPANFFAKPPIFTSRTLKPRMYQTPEAHYAERRYRPFALPSHTNNPRNLRYPRQWKRHNHLILYYKTEGSANRVVDLSFVSEAQGTRPMNYLRPRYRYS